MRHFYYGHISRYICGRFKYAHNFLVSWLFSLLHREHVAYHDVIHLVEHHIFQSDWGLGRSLVHCGYGGQNITRRTDTPYFQGVLRCVWRPVVRRNGPKDLPVRDTNPRVPPLSVNCYSHLDSYQWVRPFFVESPIFLPTPTLANTIGSLWLIFWPAYILLVMRYRLHKLSQIKLPSTHHRLLLACFSTSLLLLAVNISHAYYYFVFNSINLAITRHLEVCPRSAVALSSPELTL